MGLGKTISTNFIHFDWRLFAAITEQLAMGYYNAATYFMSRSHCDHGNFTLLPG